MEQTTVMELAGMPAPWTLQRWESAGQTVVTFGPRVVFRYDSQDMGLRNLAVVALTDAKSQSGKDIAAEFGLTQEYVSILRRRARTCGSAGLVAKKRGRPAKLTERQVRQARIWAGEQMTRTEIATRLGMSRSVISELVTTLGVIPPQDELDLAGDDIAEPVPATPGPDPAEDPASAGDAVAGEVPATGDPAVAEDETIVEPATVEPVSGELPATRITSGVFTSRYAGAMLTHAFTDRVGATQVLGSVAGDLTSRWFDDVGLLGATSLAFSLGAATIEGVKHLTRAEAGVLVGLARLPDLRTLRPRLATLADGCDPLALQRAFATAMLDTEHCESGVYFVDDHFVPYTGAKPVGKGWNTKRRHAERGRADTLVVDYTGRAVVFTTGEPSGLTKTLPAALAELRQVTGPTAKIMLGFDRGGSYPSVFSACRDAAVDWITYRRAPLAVTRHLPLAAATTRNGTAQPVAYTDEMVTIDGYGPARQITVFDHGQPVLQVLTSDTTACPLALLALIKARWRIENVFKYAEHYGIDALADYIAEVKTNTRPVDNPARKQANTAAKALKTDLADTQRALAELITDYDLDLPTKNRRLIALQDTLATTQKAIAAADTARKKIPAKLPANQVNPDAQRALLRTGRRGLQMVLRLLAYNAEHWLANHLNAYLRDTREYRAITRESIIRGLAGTITYTPTTITVALDQPDTPKLARALTLLLEEINHTPPHLPGDPRPITYTTRPPPADPLPGCNAACGARPR